MSIATCHRMPDAEPVRIHTVLSAMTSVQSILKSFTAHINYFIIALYTK